MPRTKSNLFGFGRKKAAPRAKAAARSSMTIGEAAAKAYTAGKESGDTGLFQSWLKAQGLQDRGNVLKDRLEREYRRGVDAPTSPATVARKEDANKLNREFLEKLKTQRQEKEPGEKSPKSLKPYKGYKIARTPDGEYFSSLDTDSWYETVSAVHKSIDDYLKNRTNPASYRGMPSGKLETMLIYARARAYDQDWYVRQQGRKDVEAIEHALKLARKRETKNPTDRAHRYRANRDMPKHEKRCAFCGTKTGLIEAGHVDGHEEHNEPDNLTWTCRPCNVTAANTMRSAGRGRLTRQYNPTKSGGAKSLGEWLSAVGSITPIVDRGDRGLVQTMSVSEAVAMIRATPHSKRSEFAREIRERSRKRSAERYNPDHPNADMQRELIRSAETARSVEELRRLHAAALKTRNERLLSAVEQRATRLGIRHQDLTRVTGFNRRNPEAAADHFYKKFHGQPPAETVIIETELHEHEHLAPLGHLTEVWIETESGLLAHIEFDPENMPYLSANETRYEVGEVTIEPGCQLYIEGGDQDLDLKSVKMDGPEWVKERMVIGRFAEPEPKGAGKDRRAHNITYQTRKSFDDFQLIDYQHDLGEESGQRPMLEYEPQNRKLYVTGGQYRIKLPTFGVSPGIEN